jgi:thymidylate synthase
MPHDIFSFTMLQELVSAELGLELGTYKHAVGSLHIYEPQFEEATQYLSEGFQTRKAPMPPIPAGSPWPAVGALLECEKRIRSGESLREISLDGLHPYWADLVRMLEVLRASRDKDVTWLVTLRGSMSSEIFLEFIDQRIRSLQ